jgi:hypothetical protein
MFMECGNQKADDNFVFNGTGVLNSGFHTCKAGGLEPYLQSILLWLFWRWDLMNFFSQGWPRTMILPISASQVGRITGVPRKQVIK